MKKLDFKKMRDQKKKKSNHRLRILEEILPKVDQQYKTLLKYTPKSIASSAKVKEEVLNGAKESESETQGKKPDANICRSSEYLNDTIRKLNIYLKKVEIFNSRDSEAFPLDQILYSDYSSGQKSLLIADQVQVFLSEELSPKFQFRLLASYSGNSFV